MKVGIVHGAGINPDGSLQPHTKARADKAFEVYDKSIVDILIICGKNEAGPIASYLVDKGVDIRKIVIEPSSYSTLSNLYYCNMLLFLLAHLKPIERVYPISNYWHIPRLSYDARKILREYEIKCLPADDPRNKEEIEKDKRWEGFKSISDRIMLKLGYGKDFDRELFLATVTLGTIMMNDFFNPISTTPRKVIESSIDLAIPSYQKNLMKLEKMLYGAMKVV
ncbi:MAG: YdcF family protein [Nitrososphaeria archaeon]